MTIFFFKFYTAVCILPDVIKNFKKLLMQASIKVEENIFSNRYYVISVKIDKNGCKKMLNKKEKTNYKQCIIYYVVFKYFPMLYYSVK